MSFADPTAWAELARALAALVRALQGSAPRSGRRAGDRLSDGVGHEQANKPPANSEEATTKEASGEAKPSEARIAPSRKDR